MYINTFYMAVQYITKHQHIVINTTLISRSVSAIAGAGTGVQTLFILLTHFLLWFFLFSLCLFLTHQKTSSLRHHRNSLDTFGGVFHRAAVHVTCIQSRYIPLHPGTHLSTSVPAQFPRSFLDMRIVETNEDGGCVSYGVPHQFPVILWGWNQTFLLLQKDVCQLFLRVWILEDVIGTSNHLQVS